MEHLVLSLVCLVCLYQHAGIAVVQRERGLYIELLRPSGSENPTAAGWTTRAQFQRPVITSATFLFEGHCSGSPNECYAL